MEAAYFHVNPLLVGDCIRLLFSFAPHHAHKKCIVLLCKSVFDQCCRSASESCNFGWIKKLLVYSSLWWVFDLYELFWKFDVEFLDEKLQILVRKLVFLGNACFSFCISLYTKNNDLCLKIALNNTDSKITNKRREIYIPFKVHLNIF